MPAAEAARHLGGWRLQRRVAPKRLGAVRAASFAIALLVALAVGPLAAGLPAEAFYPQVWVGTLGSTLGFENVLATAVPLVIAGLAASIPYRLRLWNIGIDGQMFMGAWLAAAVAFALPGAPGPLLVLLMIAGGLAGGAAWALIPALARAFLGVNEIVTTFLMNFPAMAWLTYLDTGPWHDPNNRAGGIRSFTLPAQSALHPIQIGDLMVPWGLVVAAVLPFVLWAGITFTKLGFGITISGANSAAAEVAGISVRRNIITTLLAGGALAGLAGTLLMMGELHQYSEGLTHGTGFTAVVIAVIALGFEPGVLLVGLIYAVMLVSGNALSIQGVSANIVFALIGLTLLLVAVGDQLALYRLVRATPDRGAAHPVPAQGDVS